jgi:cytochrome P450
MRRKVHMPHTFSDGTYVPVGTIIGVPTLPHQMDGANYQNPNEFDPTRFVHAKEGEATRKHFATIDPEYLAFGIGRCSTHRTFSVHS